MDPYKAPASDLSASNIDAPRFRPVLGITVGLTITIILATVVSTLLAVGYAIISGSDLASGEQLTAATNTLGFMTLDTIISFLILFFAGRFVASKTRGRELFYASILAFITLSLYFVMSYLTDSFDTYPAAYVVLTLLLTPVAILLGARSRARPVKMSV